MANESFKSLDRRLVDTTGQLCGKFVRRLGRCGQAIGQVVIQWAGDRQSTRQAIGQLGELTENDPAMTLGRQLPKCAQGNKQAGRQADWQAGRPIKIESTCNLMQCWCSCVSIKIFTFASP